MSEKRTVVEETQERCSLCGGMGVETDMTVTSGATPCRLCNGAKFVVTKRVVRTESE